MENKNQTIVIFARSEKYIYNQGNIFQCILWWWTSSYGPTLMA